MNVSALLSFSLFYSYILTESKGPGRETTVALLILFIIWISPRLYKNGLFKLPEPSREYFVIAPLLIIAILSYGHDLFNSITSDEIWHSFKSNFVLTKFSRLVNEWPPLSIEEARANPWSRFDFRIMSVTDVWRLLTVPIWIFIFLSASLINWISKLEMRRKLFFSAALLALGILLSKFFQTHVDPHPPLRLLPWFVGQLVFGLNEFGLRLTGVILWSLVSTWIYFVLRKQQVTQILSFSAALATLFVPQAFYSIQIIEHSHYGYFTWLIVLILTGRYLVHKNADDVIRIGVVIGIGSLMRHTGLLLWIIPVMLIAFNSQLRRDRRFLAATFLPLLLCVHYLATVKSLGNSSAELQTALTEKAKLLWSNQQSLTAVIGTTTWPWVFTSLIGFSLLVKAKRKESVLFLLLPILWTLYLLPIGEGLWPTARYQAEYIGAFVGFLVVTLALTIKSQKSNYLYIFTLGILSATTMRTDRELAFDTYYPTYYSMKYTNSQYYPYRAALNYMKYQEATEHFVILGGSPGLAPMNLWLSGFNFIETERTVQRQFQFDNKISKENLSAAIENAGDIKYILVLGGSRRERIVRSSEVVKALESFELALKNKSCSITLDKTFGPEGGTFIDVYRVDALSACLR